MHHPDQERKAWVVKRRTDLLLALIQQLTGDARISFEGDLQDLRILNLPGASHDETVVLKRNTTWPKQDFAVVPVTATEEKVLKSAIGGNVSKKLIHIQIERDGILEFGAYDNFQSIFFGPGVSPKFLASLAERGILTTR